MHTYALHAMWCMRVYTNSPNTHTDSIHARTSNMHPHTHLNTSGPPWNKIREFALPNSLVEILKCQFDTKCIMWKYHGANVSNQSKAELNYTKFLRVNNSSIRNALCEITIESICENYHRSNVSNVSKANVELYENLLLIIARYEMRYVKTSWKIHVEIS